ncbi:phosphoribosylanthranilate isomerase [Phaeodactylibacter xiamenensis]|uniref:N-(5'-phosphoribosyl)anthranilate isomerase n=1 Tax=Phaeodactylibacter xiamenensis TaxID=1524460 RepID=A0A098S7T0_9BACT|nr:phosphoribosylanthranilate isomerase [Phaeodactylibacter xiamenensis]KGE88161.1 N-(5'-phosphoribosyl)anthranilate isomerase [Phaeodactylibacter xiamenensis]MCR9054215.1 phosphoribosylanthranilate isomerase [bacterium]
MYKSVSPRVKICCISNVQEAQLAVQYGADALGLVGPMPSGPGTLTNNAIAQIVLDIPPPVASFLLTSETRAEAIIAHHKKVHTNTLQLVDALSEGTYADIRAALPAVKLVQVIHVLDEGSVEEAVRVSESVDALLLDSGNPSLKIKELGGTGRTHDWSLSRRIVEQARAPVFLAGGLNAQNVRQAIEAVQPFGIDLCSGVRTDGQLDEAKLAAFFHAVA